MHIHPASHNTGTDNRFFSFMSGHMWHCLASCGSSSIFNSFVFVDVISDLFAHITLIGTWGMSLPAQSSPKKCPVHAESGMVCITFVVVVRRCSFVCMSLSLYLLISAIAYDMFCLILLGEDATVLLIVDLLVLLLILLLTVILHWFFFPRRHMFFFFGMVNGIPFSLK